MSRLRWWRSHDETPVVELQRYKPVRAGVVVIVAALVIVYFGFTKHVPFTHGFRLKGEFASALNVHPKSPVRIAGVDVGVVSSVKREGPTGLVTMEIENKGLPIHRDATLKIRPKLFLEGNFYVELQPGSPTEPTVSSGYVIPVTHTYDPVQIDQVLDALNTDTRANLQEFLYGYGKALTSKGTPAEDAEQEPEVRGKTGAQALNQAYRRGPVALRDSTIVNQAIGGVEQNDLSNLITGIARFSEGLNGHENELGEWLVNFDAFMHNFAAQSKSLSATVAELPGAFGNARRAFAAANKALGPTATFSLAFVPGIEQIPATIDATLPWIAQVKPALGPTEIGGLAKGLRAAAPAFASLVAAQPSFFHSQELFARCLTNVIFPAGNTKLQDGANTSGEEDYKEFWYALTGFAGIGQGFDGNGTTTRFVVGGGGESLVSAPASVVGAEKNAQQLKLIAHAPLKPEGTRPSFPASEPPFKPLVPCYTQKLPNFNGPLASGPADGSGG
jgi:phospholipid/cholesterol/gamma-HCH transport system substrate-binding protein